MFGGESLEITLEHLPESFNVTRVFAIDFSECFWDNVSHICRLHPASLQHPFNFTKIAVGEVLSTFVEVIRLNDSNSDVLSVALFRNDHISRHHDVCKLIASKNIILVILPIIVDLTVLEPNQFFGRKIIEVTQIPTD